MVQLEPKLLSFLGANSNGHTAELRLLQVHKIARINTQEFLVSLTLAEA